MKKKIKGWAVVDRFGRGFDNQIGAKTRPNIFTDKLLALSFIADINARWEVNGYLGIEARPCTITYSLPTKKK